MHANAGVIMSFPPSYPIDACHISAECDATVDSLQTLRYQT